MINLPSTMMQEIKVEDAIGMVLAHDLTQIIPGEFKGRLFKKGHVVQEEDIQSLLDIGKQHIYVLNLEKGYVHEDDAALRMIEAIGGKNVTWSDPAEGKVTMKATIDGLVKIHPSFIHEVNRLGEVAIATVLNYTVAKQGDAVLATRVIPLIVRNAKVEVVERLAQVIKKQQQHIVEVKPFKKLKVGLVTTGSEILTGRIKDRFGPVVKEKVHALGSTVIEQKFVNDDIEDIHEQIQYFLSQSCDLILVTGGMSVDPDDRTPGAIARSGADIVSYGTPMLPGSMLMMAYVDDIPIMGLPGCVMHDPHTSFDVLLPRICAGEKIVKEHIEQLGYGGLHRC
ncbi:molybdopterin-binding protein [Longirhabdus pacifica]|uniref:molybdopterin-binding protein n=1 Tax=Longirhabdus pacifica TaxID=2305227 RepID=UPI001F0CCB68|nr:molybdopterin-binding protein [Longirhabdus pacifica]